MDESDSSHSQDEEWPAGGVEAAGESSLLLPGAEHTSRTASLSASQHSFYSTHAASPASMAINIQRPAYDLATFDTHYDRIQPPHVPLAQRLKTCITKKCACSAECAKQKLLGLFPFISIMRGYQWKKWIVSDIISGLCVGVIHIPQSMGFAILTSLPPVYGLYASLYPILLYFLLGTSRHISVGTMAIISILIGNVVERDAADFVPSSLPPSNDSLPAINTTGSTDITQSGDSEELLQFKIGVAMAMTFLVGVIQLAMSFLKLGIVATFMSMSFIGGFMAGATIHIYASQVPFCLGISIPRQTGIFRNPKIWYYIFKNLPNVNAAEVVVSLICIILLVLIKEVINEKFKDKLKVPIPAELLVVILVTLVSYLAKLHQRYDVRILNEIPTGLPAPKVPNFDNAPSYILDAIIIAIVSFAISISLAKFFSQKYHYPIDQDQEMFAYGVMHTISPFFGGFAGAQAPPRTMVHDSTGGKTQLASLVSALLILLVCLLLAPLFEHLPNSALGSIIMVALIPLLKRFQDLPHMWRVNRYDFFVWVLTFLAVVILDIDIGLAIGLGISILTLVVETHLAKGEVYGHVDKTELYVPEAQYAGLADNTKLGLHVFKFQSLLYYANTEALKSQIFEKTINPAQLMRMQGVTVEKADEAQLDKDHPAVNGSLEVPNGKEPDKENNNALADKPAASVPSLTGGGIKDGESLDSKQPCAGMVILDCSAITYIDLMGLNLLKQLIKQYTEVHVIFALANCNEALQRKLEANGTETGGLVYPSVQDAVTLTLAQRTEVTKF